MPSTYADESCVLVIFGASGDLTKRKLVPALYSLARDGDAARAFGVVGVAAPRDPDATSSARHARGVDKFARRQPPSTGALWDDASPQGSTTPNGAFEDPGLREAQARPRELESSTDRWTTGSSTCRPRPPSIRLISTMLGEAGLSTRGTVTEARLRG